MTWFMIALIAVIAYGLHRVGSGGRQQNVIDTTRNSVKFLASRKKVIEEDFLVRTLHGERRKADINDRIFLHPEPTNKYDETAIVVATDTISFGYVAREENALLFDYLINGGKYFAEIDWMTNDRPFRYVVRVYSMERIGGGRFDGDDDDYDEDD